jgi:alpha-L-fucosidase
MKRLLAAFIAWLLVTGMAYSQQTAQSVNSLSPCGPVPTEDQLWWQDLEMYAFIHYSMNTYTEQ